MEIDFHYYATFAAARVAGFSPEDAATIAHSAQYVDDSSLSRLAEGAQVARYLSDPSSGYKSYISAFRPVATYQPESELARLELQAAFTNSDITAFRRVWSVFHFLPGNYDGNPDVRSYGGNRKWAGGVNSYDKDAEQAFKLMCLPRSRLVGEMINDVAGSRYASAHNRLHLAGIRMHVLADTWAHCYYAGTPQYWINDAGQEVVGIDANTGDRREVRWVQANWLGALSAAKGDGEWAITPSAFVQSVCYLGHGRMGHLPDYPWMVYDYEPKWSGSRIVKDNPTDYLRGFAQMCAALRAIRTGSHFDPLTTGEPTAEMKDKVGGIIRLSAAPGIARDAEARARVWKEQLPNLEIDGVKVGAAPDYNPDAWLNAASGRYDEVSTDYFRFNLAARQHHDFVIETLHNHTGIDLNAGNIGFSDDLKDAAKWMTSAGGKAIRGVIELGDQAYEGGKSVVREVGRAAEETGRGVSAAFDKLKNLF